MRVTRMAIAVSTAALAVAGLTACGGDSEEKSNAGTDAKVLADEALALLKGVDAYKMVGGGKSEEMTMDWDICIKGSDLTGSMKMDGSPVEMIKIGKDLFMKADAAFWAKTMGGEVEEASTKDAALKLMDGKYVKTPADDGFGDPTDFFDGSTDGVVKGEVVTIDGMKLIPLSKKQKDEEDTTTLYVAEKGKPYPILVKVEGGTTLNLKITKGKTKCAPTAPPADQVVDQGALEKLDG
ncbi:hypothetical protein [Embleya sp. NBC_00896]|uniref:hypothetical protein n=1 Tax=Embleya sp. NBC_00896 TaxID=2975961 RepID=UPI003869469E|nr:hypothetical protein OG928_12385 [Embleya sp. NBC_00896]